MTRENLQIVSQDGSRAGQRILRLAGPVSIHTVFEFQGAVRAESSPRLILDFSKVPFMDSSGLGALVGALVSAQKAGRSLALAAANAQVTTLLDMTRTLALFRVYSTVDEAEAAAA